MKEVSGRFLERLFFRILFGFTTQQDSICLKKRPKSETKSKNRFSEGRLLSLSPLKMKIS